MRSHCKLKNHRMSYSPLTVIKQPHISNYLLEKYTVNLRVKSCWGYENTCDIILSSRSCGQHGVVMGIHIILIEGERG